MTRLSVYPPTPCKLAGAASVSGSSHRERDDTYGKVIVHLAPRWRVIICKDSIQAILQKRSVPFPNTGTWAGRRYCTSREALIRDCSELGLLSDATEQALLDLLPEILRAPSQKMSRD